MGNTLSSRALKPTLVFCDNKGALELVKNNKHHKRTKHIELRYFYARDQEKKDEIITAAVPTEQNLSDCFTKGVDINVILDHRYSIHGMDQLPRSTSVVYHKVPNPNTKIKANSSSS